MAVYKKDRADYLQAAINRMLHQTLHAHEIILMCDGPLTVELDQVIDIYSDQLTVVRLPENRGLGAALSEGLKHCRCEWIARMDSDDIAASDRCERQMHFLQEHADIDIVSGTIAEFEGDAQDEVEARAQMTAYKRVPETHDEIAHYIKYRNPINHPCVMFRRSSVLAAGGYQPCPFFEDYDLWVRMMMNHCRFANLGDTLLYMRVDGMHQRRGGMSYVKAIVSFRTRMYRFHMLTFGEYLWTTAARAAVSLMPNGLRRMIYDRKLREH
jgi:glycosyltransferase involved in cell wall biosynthesis